MGLTRPCIARHPVPVTTGCRTCWLFLNREDYRDLWKENELKQAESATPEAAQKAIAARQAAIREKFAVRCIHLGEATGEKRGCVACGNRHLDEPVYHCAIKGQCTVERRVDGLTFCRQCPDRRDKPFEEETETDANRFLPGIIDPIPGPEINEEEAKRTETRDRHVAAFRRLLRTNIPQATQTPVGQGILFCGGGRYWVGIVIACRLLRETGCTLPIQVWYRGSEETVEPADVEGLNVRLIDADSVRNEHPCRILRGWEIKTYAILHCGWRQVFYLDGDAYFVADPSPAFELLKKAPFVFWEDLEGNRQTLKWRWFGLDEHKSDKMVPPVQGGQLLIDTVAFRRELVIAHWINQHSDYFFKHQYGDQDSWRAVLVAGNDPTRFYCHEKADWRDIAFVCHVPTSENPRTPVVVHRCRGKLLLPWFVGGNNRFVGHLPSEARVHEIYRSLLPTTARETFEQIYRDGAWGPRYQSGQGSTIGHAAPWLMLIDTLIRFAGAETVVDLGSGDGTLFSLLKENGRNLIGVDCCKSQIDRLKKAEPLIDWRVYDLDKDREHLPEGDLAILKDVLHHWPDRLVADWLHWAIAAKKWKRLVICNDWLDRARKNEKRDCPLGGWRPLGDYHPPLSEIPGLRRVMHYAQKAVWFVDITAAIK